MSTHGPYGRGRGPAAGIEHSVPRIRSEFKESAERFTLKVKVKPLLERIQKAAQPVPPQLVPMLLDGFEYFLNSYHLARCLELGYVAGSLSSQVPFPLSAPKNPNPIELRMFRLSASLYLADVLKELLPKVIAGNNNLLSRTFYDAIVDSERLFRDSYFSKSRAELDSVHLRLQQPIVACAMHCGVVWMGIKSAANAYEARVNTELLRLTSKTPGPEDSRPDAVVLRFVRQDSSFQK